MKILFVFNHRAGTGLDASMISNTIDTIHSQGHFARFMPSFELLNNPGLSAQDFLPYDRILCYGGDGTMSQLVAKLYKLDILDKCDLGYIPGGSTNDFGGSLGLSSMSRTAALSSALGQEIETFDMGLFNGQPFIYVAAFGLFTELSYSTDQNLKNLLGHGAYLLNGAKSLFSIKSHHITIRVDDGTPQEGDYILGLISNSSQVGGFKKVLGTDVSMSDGLFEVTLLREIRGVQNIQSILTLFDPAFKSIYPDSMIQYKGKKIEIHSDHAIDWTLDGEYGGQSDDVTINVKDLAIKLAINHDMPIYNRSQNLIEMALSNLLENSTSKSP